MNIHQLSVAYQLDQDRILVQINTLDAEELRVWLTRRLVINLMPHLGREVINLEVRTGQLASQDEGTKKMLVEFKKQASITQGDFKTPFNAVAKKFPIGAEPLLVTHMNLTLSGNDTLRLGFEERLATATQPRSFEVNMASDLIHGFMHLLESAIKASEWGVLPRSNPDEASDNTGDKTKPAAPFRYLN